MAAPEAAVAAASPHCPPRRPDKPADAPEKPEADADPEPTADADTAQTQTQPQSHPQPSMEPDTENEVIDDAITLEQGDKSSADHATDENADTDDIRTDNAENRSIMMTDKCDNVENANAKKDNIDTEKSSAEAENNNLASHTGRNSLSFDDKDNLSAINQDDEFIPVIDESLSFKEDNCTSGESESEAVNLNQENELGDKTAGDKRPNTEDSSGEQCPSKKLCQELQDTFQRHDSILSDYIASLSCNNDDEINKHTENLIGEIDVLRELANAKEVEWNHLLHLRKVKEEILLRLLRKKNILSLEKTANSISDYNKETINKQILELNKNCVDDKNDEANRLRQKPMAMSGNGVQLNSSGLMMVPVNSGIYCQSNMNNFNFENHLGMNPYANKGMMHKPVMIAPGHRMPDFSMPEMNGQASRYNQQMGRQGPIKDVQSIIADYRQRHPEAVPRRGRRIKSLLHQQVPRMPVPHNDNVADLGLLFGGVDTNPHLPSIDAVSLQQNSMQQGGLPNGMSFKDVLVQFANMTGQPQPGCMGARLPPPPPYPEVTLHPVGVPPSSMNSPFSAKMQQLPQPNSLLHGILTKSQPRQDNRFSTFSPTLARLLTAPEKNVPANNTCRTGNPGNANNFISQKESSMLQTCSEITITAVQPPNNNQLNRHQQEVVQLDDFEEAELEEDSTDRPLVIDESGRGENNTATRDLGSGSVELGENEVPECQGCRRREAQFVCAGCANQWYCSRECQVSAWDEHSEVCSG